MVERPILFSGPMVRAILDGRKTQARRTMKMQPEPIPKDAEFGKPGHWIPFNAAQSMVRNEEMAWACPYGRPRDRLWVRETWGVISHSWNEQGQRVDWIPDRPATPIYEMPFGRGYYSGHAIYAADGSMEWAGDDDGGGEPRSAWKPSIHMPRVASRILLEITSVRVERLQEISPDDCIAEGAWSTEQRLLGQGHKAVSAFQELWQSINGADSWDANPWVWVIEFKNLKPTSNNQCKCTFSQKLTGDGCDCCNPEPAT